MKKLVQLICLSFIMMMSAQCGNEHPEPELEPEPTQEIWELTYDDYHVLYYSNSQYQNLTRKVKVSRGGDKLYINGIFPAYPDVWIKCTVRNDSVFIGQAQTMRKNEDGTKVYFLWGFSRFEWYAGTTSHQTIYFERAGSERAAFVLTHDGQEMHPVEGSKDDKTTFWYSDSRESFYYDQWHSLEVPDYSGGTGFPDVGFMVNMVFRKVGEAAGDTDNL